MRSSRRSYIPWAYFRLAVLGGLTEATISIQVGEEELELGTTRRYLQPNEIYELFVEERDSLYNFLRKQSPNLEIKVIFAFRKFKRSYDFVVLSSQVGNWQEKIPGDSYNLALPYELPLDKLPEKEFERLCEWIVAKHADPQFHKVLRLNEDGGGEKGRDVLAEEVGTGRRFVFQCKRVLGFGPADVRKELEQFARYVYEDPSIKPDVYVLFVSSSISPEAKAVGDEIAERLEMEIQYWTKTTIDRKARSNPEILERFWKNVQ